MRVWSFEDQDVLVHVHWDCFGSKDDQLMMYLKQIKIMISLLNHIHR
jgi:hypothetical protein